MVYTTLRCGVELMRQVKIIEMGKFPVRGWVCAMNDETFSIQHDSDTSVFTKHRYDSISEIALVT